MSPVIVLICVAAVTASCGNPATNLSTPATKKDPLDALICTQEDKGEYKNLTRCVYKNPGAPNTLTQDEINDGWQLLFDGISLRGWRPHGSGDWKVVDGILTCESPSLGSTATNATGRMLGWIGTDEAYRDFELKVQFRLPEGGDSGVSFRTPEVVGTWSEGYEIQLLDDATWPRPAQRPTWEAFNASPSGSILEFIRAEYPAGVPFPPANAWNDLTVKVIGHHIRVEMNNVEVLNEIDEKKKHDIGYIGLQYYFVDKKTEFRNIKVRPLLYGGPIYGGDGVGGRYRKEREAAKAGREAAAARAEARREAAAARAEARSSSK